MTRPYDVLPCGFLSFADSGIIQQCNTTLASWLGYAPEELEGSTIENIFTIASRIFYNTHFFPLIRLHSKASEIFLSLKNKENRQIPVLANAERITAGSDHIIYCAFMRVEERKKYEQEILDAKKQAENTLKENKELIDMTKALESHSLQLERHFQHQLAMNEDLLQFSKIISHDLQEPIHKIQVFTDLILRDSDTNLSDRSKELTAKIDVAALRLQSLTRSLQEYITVDNEKAYTAIDLNAVIDAARVNASNLRQYSDFLMDVEKMPSIDGYEKQLELLFFHLMDNAIQFRDSSRKLEIKVRQMTLTENVFRVSKEQYKYADYVRITFEDNGIGFSQKYSDYVFQLLKKIDSSTTGLGVGLSLVKKIVQNHSGTIRVKSQPGKGTRFEMEFPLRTA